MALLPIRVLIVEDRPADAELILHALQQAGFEPTAKRAETETEYLTHLESAPDFILCDYNLLQFSAMRALELLQERRLEIPLLIVSGSIGEEAAVETIKQGASDYILKDRLGRLGSAVTRALELRKLRDAERLNRETLRASATLYRALADSIPHIVWTARTDGLIDYVNQRSVDYSGCGAEHFATAGWEPLIHPDDLSRTIEQWGNVLRTGVPHDVEFRLRRADGIFRWHMTRQVAIRDEMGTIVQWFGTCTDIEDQKGSVALLRFQNALLECQTEASPDGILVVGPDKNILSYNHRFLELWDIPPELAKAGDDTPVLALARSRVADPSAFTARVEAIYADPDTRTDEEVVLADGRTLDRYSAPIRGAAGELLGRIWFFRDITNRKHAEELFRQARERLQHVIASSPAILFSLAIEADHIRGIAWMSENVRDVLGYSPAETNGTAWWKENMHPEDRDRVMASTDQGLIAKGRVTHEYRFKHQNGQYRWLRSEIRLVLDATGESVEAIGSWSDITERQLLEEQYRQAQKMEAFGQLSAGIAHDFNNLLTVINGYSDLLIDEISPTDPQRISAIEIREAGGRAAALTAQLLAFSRRTIVEPKIFDLNELIERVVKMLRRLIGEDITLVTELSPTLSRVKADQSQMEQLIMNLAVNARDAMPKGGRLTIGTRNTEALSLATHATPDRIPSKHVRITVSDTGTGMTNEVKAKLFEPFFTTKGVGKGTGLGLATVFGIVKQAGGQIDVMSAVGVGTIFTVLLPVASDTTVKPPTVKLGIPKLGSETILLVEDEQQVRTFAKRALQTQGYTVLEAGDGAEALRVLATHTGLIHLLLTDVVMPGMGGRDLAMAVRTQRPTVRVLYMSGYTDDAIVRHGVVEETDAFLQKPFTPLALARKVREVLDPSG